MDPIVYVTVRLQLLVCDVNDIVPIDPRLNEAVGVLAEPRVYAAQPVCEVIGVTCGVVGVGFQHAELS